MSVSHGARPVAVGRTRSQVLAQPAGELDADLDLVISRRQDGPRRLPEVVAQLRSLVWSPGQRVVVCSLAGGAGRTSVAAGLATVLAETRAGDPRAVLLCDASSSRLSGTPRRWGVDPAAPSVSSLRWVLSTGYWAGLDTLGRTPAGVPVLLGAEPGGPPPLPGDSARACEEVGRSFDAVVVDAPRGLPSDLPWVVETDGPVSVVLVTRPDGASLAEAAEALVWMHDQGLVRRRDVTVLVNNGSGEGTRGSRAAATVLSTRCAGLHQLPRSRELAAGTTPTGRRLAGELRLRLSQVLVSVHRDSVRVADPVPGSGSSEGESA